jgi:RNA polymerase sigma-70 factor (ECF subfamily)
MEQEFDLVFHRLFKENYTQLLVYATTIVGPSVAEDIVEDVFMNLWGHRDTIVVGDRILAFLYRAVFTRSINELHRRRTSTGYITLLEDINEQRLNYIDHQADNGEQRTEQQELQQHLDSAIEALPDKCRQVFRLSYLQGMSNKDIAEVLEISVRTVEAHMYKALHQLRADLKKYKVFLSFFIFP